MSSFKRFTILLLSSITFSACTSYPNGEDVPLEYNTVVILDTIVHADSSNYHINLVKNFDSVVHTFQESEKKIHKLDSVVQLKCKRKKLTYK